ncbi:MAG TPA: CUAEP/CCAEP-tail radical SAM protein, partial [Vicinamibacterales bacterium]
MNLVLISTYDLGRQPFGVASPAAWLRRAGHHVDTIDLSRERLRPDAIAGAETIAFYLPMHT